MEINEIYIWRCIELAQKGVGTARPNPSVGCVVVWDDVIIGEGFTSSYGGNHAEVNAIEAVKDKSKLSEATIYVTLEPCSHYGKTPPCADLIVRHKIPRVVIGCVDTSSQVAGKGIERLKNAGCEVVVGVLEKECLMQHKRFFAVQNKKRPYVILKWAETLDGFIAPLKRNENRPVWISNSESQQLVHKWRSEEHAILVGTNTAIEDNPKLDVRNWKGNAPIRVVLDRSVKIPKDYSLFDEKQLTIVLVDKSCKDIPVSKKNLRYEFLDFSKEVSGQICDLLMKYNVQSVLVEGGSQTLKTFIDSELWDEARVFVGHMSFKEGVEAPVLEEYSFEESMLKETKLKMYKNSKHIL